MRSETYYSWDNDDPSLTFVTSAINLLATFKDGSSDDELGVKAYQRVVTNRHFTEQDLTHLKKYLQRLAERALNKYEHPKLADAPWRDAIMDAVRNAGEACQSLDEIFTVALSP